MKANKVISALDQSHLTSLSGLIVNKPVRSPMKGCKRCVDYFRTIEEKNATIKNLQRDLKDLRAKYEAAIKKLDSINKETASSIRKKFRLNTETLSFLIENQDKNLFAKKIKECKEGSNFELDNLKSTELEILTKDFTSILQICFNKLCETRDPQIRTSWQTKIYNLVEAVYQTRFGEDSYKHIQKAVKTLLNDYATVIPTNEIVDNNLIRNLQDFDDKYLFSWAFKAATTFKTETQRDLETVVKFGTSVATPSELQVLKIACDHVQKLYKIFESEMHDLLEEKLDGKAFKANCKSFDRSQWKLDEYASEGKHPTFEYLGDLLRCRAAFDKVDHLISAYEIIRQKYKIVKLKNKLQSGLKNITFNFIYKGVIAEMQLILGSIAAELENHQLYEAIRCRSIIELYDVVEKWGGYNHLTEKDEVNGNLVDSRPAKNHQVEYEKLVPMKFDHAPADSHIRILRTTEQGITDVLSDTWDSGLALDETNKFTIFIEEIENILQPITTSSQKNGVEKIQLESKENLLTAVEGKFNSDKGEITFLKFLNATGEILKIGVENKIDKSFTIKAPNGYYIVGFGGKKSKTNETSKISHLMSLYCWISKIEPCISSDGSKYEGSFQNKKKNGFGILEKDGSSYEGYWQDDKEHGQGTKLYKNGDKYTGTWANGLRSGIGVCNYVNGEIYKGSWAHDSRSGIGEYYYENDDYYVGHWKNDLKDGQGTFHFKINKNNAVYVGSFEAGLAHGEGKLNIIDLNMTFEGTFNKGIPNRKGQASFIGYIDEGQWIDGNKEGLGFIRFKSGETLQGTWKNNLLEGEATFIDIDGEKSTSYYKLGVILSGKSIELGKGGERYKGFFKNGKRSGYGQYWNRFGALEHECEWKYGMRHGKGIYYDPWGGKLDCFWGRNLLMGRCEHTDKEGNKFSNVYSGGEALETDKDSISIKGEKVILKLKNGSYSKIFFPDGSQYEGEVDEGFFKKGEITYPDGSKLGGNFSYYSMKAFLTLGKKGNLDDVLCYYQRGLIYRGEFGENKLPHGRGLVSWPNRGVIFQGNFENGIAKGEGTYFDENGSGFVNYYYNGAVKNGKGVKINFDKSIIQEGDFRSGVLHGNGIEYEFDGYNIEKIYEGEWTEGLKSKKGTIYKQGAIHFQGNFEKNMKNGKGTLITDYGEILEGIYKDDKIFTGQGMYRQTQYRYYIGDFVEGKFDGFVRFYEFCTKIYEGTWTKNRLEGKGKLFRYDGTLLYEGDFKNAKPDGIGIYYDQEGKTYEVQLEEGKVKGKIGFMFEFQGNMYEGEFVDSLPSGKGKLYNYKGNLKYEGEFLNGKYHGKGRSYELRKKDPGIEAYDDYETYLEYEGDWFEDAKHGFGISYYMTGEKCWEGYWQNLSREGKGTYYDINENFFYEGTIVDGMLKGDSIFITPDGERLESYCDNGPYSKKGIKSLAEGWLYVGDFSEGSAHGSGKLYYKSKLVFDGHFAKNKIEGQGTYFTKTGEMWTGTYREGKLVEGKGFEYKYCIDYEGEASNGMKNGFGIYYEYDKVKYIGQWKNDSFEGQGKTYNASGKLLCEGEFAKDRLNGHAKEYRENGEVLYEGEFKNGNYEGKGIFYYEGVAYEGFYESGNIKSGKGIKGDVICEFKEGIANGKGMSLDSYSKYVGEFVDGYKSGYGVELEYNTKLPKYEGQYSKGQRHGKGKSYYADGSLEYEGDWVESSKEGIGRHYDNEGKLLYEGEFVYDRYKGKGKQISQEGNIMEGLYDKGIIIDGEGRIAVEDGFYEGQIQQSVPHGKGKLYKKGAILDIDGEWENGKIKSGIQSIYSNGNLIGLYHGSFIEGKLSGSGKYQDLNFYIPDPVIRR